MSNATQNNLKPSSVWLPLLILLGLVGTPCQGNADLYEAEVPIAGQGPTERNQAITAAFMKVLVKLSGDRGIAERSNLSAGLSEAPSYVQQFRYRTVSPLEGEGGRVQGEQDLQRLLSVRFDPGATEDLMRRLGLPVWSGARPTVLLWLALEEAGRRRLFMPDTDEALRTAIDQGAESRGIPLLYPLMDLEDRAAMTISDVWGDFPEAIRNASGRYVPDFILVGRLTRVSAQRWDARWSLYSNSEFQQWQGREISGEAAAVEGIDQAVDRLAAVFAPAVSGEEGNLVWLRVRDLPGFAEYARVARYLNSISTVDQVYPLTLSPEATTFEMRIRGGLKALEQAIAVGTLLEEDSSAAQPRPDVASPGNGTAAEIPTLSYRFRL